MIITLNVNPLACTEVLKGTEGKENGAQLARRARFPPLGEGQIFSGCDRVWTVSPMKNGP